MELQAKRSFPAASWSDKFDVLRMTDRALEIVESTVDSRAAKSAWPIRKRGCCEDESGEDGEIGGSMCQSDPCGRRHESGIVC